MSKLKKGDAVWTVQMNNAATHEPRAGTVTRIVRSIGNKPDTVWIHQNWLDSTGTEQSLVIDRPATEVYPDESAALEHAADKCFLTAQKYTTAAHALLKRLTELSAKLPA